MSVSAVMITLNEEANIDECLKTVRWADEIVMIDSGSTDATIERARAFTSKIYQNPFVDFASQKNAAIDRATGDWIFFLDADERVPPGLAHELQELSRHPSGGAAYSVRRRTYFMGRRLNFSGTQDDGPIRFFPKNSVRFEQPVHERVVTELPVLRLKEPLDHYTTRNFSHYQIKLRRYIPLEVKTMRLQGRSVSALDLILRPAAKFLYLYGLRLGLLDGIGGIQYAALGAYYDFMKHLTFLTSRHKEEVIV